jgi:ribosomal protein S18 acetylase RimI-like enzyme
MTATDGATGYVVDRLDRTGVTEAMDSILKVYSAALMPPPYNKSLADVQMFASIFEHQLDRDGFRSFVARVEGVIVGFAYGYASRPGGWWRDQVAEALGPGAARKWLEDAFEFTELAVHPRFQRRGLGGALHDALLDGLDARTAVLSTLQEPTRGSRLYERKGWQTLLEDFWFGGTPDPYRVMGLELPQD